MTALFTTLLSLLSGLPGTIGDYFKKKQEIEQIKIETQKQIELEKQKFAAVIAEADYKRAADSLSATSHWFKYFTFVVWFGPYMVGLVAPDWSKKIFDNLGAMPEWYVQSVVLIIFTIWGISASAPVVTNIFGSLQSYFQSRREYKLESKKLAIDKKSFYEGLRAGKGMVTPADVEKYDVLLERTNSEK